jgi:hypothetical protein
MNLSPLSDARQRAGDVRVDSLSLFEEVARALCEQFREQAGVTVYPLHEAERERVRERLQSLPIAWRTRKLESFIAHWEHLYELRTEGISPRDKPRSLRACLRKYGLRLPDETQVLAALDETTIIELYGRDFRQFYRSFDFLTATHYSVLALEFFEWHELFGRSPAITQAMTVIVEDIWSGRVRQPVFRPVPSHTVQEIWSPHPRSQRLDVRIYSPLYLESGEFGGGLHAFKLDPA